MATERVKVRMRSGPCTCGCEGQDPQHAAVLTRVVRNVTNVAGLGSGIQVLARGEIQAPWGLQAVVLRGYLTQEGRQVVLGWEKA